MAEELKLHLADECPSCGRSDRRLYRPGQEGACYVCTNAFRPDHRVYYGNVIGTICEITEDRAVSDLMSKAEDDGECICDSTDPADIVSDAEVEQYIEEHWLFVPDRRPTIWSYSQVIERTDPNLVHESAWVAPPLGPEHPVYEETLDIIRAHGGARARVAQLERSLDGAKAVEREAWKKVRPALNRLIEEARKGE